MKTKPTLLLDTNIWMDYYIPDRPLHAEAVSFISRAAEKDIDLLYAANTLKDLYYSLLVAYKRKIRKEGNGQIDSKTGHFLNMYAWGRIDNLIDFATAVGCDSSDIWLANKYHKLHSDLEDNLIIAAAERAKADYLVTNDEQLLRHCPVACADIRDAMAYIEVQAEL